MPKKKKLKLDNISVTSFITTEESSHVKGQAASAETNCIAETCIPPCTVEPTAVPCVPVSDTCNTDCGSCATCVTCVTCATDCGTCYPSVGTNNHIQCFEPIC